MSSQYDENNIFFTKILSRLMLLSRGLGTKKGLVRVTEAKGISPQHPETGILKVSRNTLGHIHGSMVVWGN